MNPQAPAEITGGSWINTEPGTLRMGYGQWADSTFRVNTRGFRTLLTSRTRVAS